MSNHKLIMLEFLIFSQLASLALIKQISHPFILAIWLVGTAALTGLTLGAFISSWMFFSVSLIFLGGMMVIFLYFTSLVVSEKLLFFNLKTSKVLFLLPLFVCLTSQTMLNSNSLNLIENNFSALNFALNFVLLSYLLWCLFSVVKLVEHFKGTLESTFF